jgi:hypothetical protein
MKFTRWPVLLGLLLALSAAGCADDRAASDGDKRGGFYGGVSAGGTRP